MKLLKTRKYKKRYKVKAGSKSAISKEFYKSKEWIKLAKLTKEIYGRRCMQCGKSRGIMNSDHIFPRSLYPELALDINNIQIICKKENKLKGNKDTIDYRTSSDLEKLRRYLIGK